MHKIAREPISIPQIVQLLPTSNTHLEQTFHKVLMSPRQHRVALLIGQEDTGWYDQTFHWFTAPSLLFGFGRYVSRHLQAEAETFRMVTHRTDVVPPKNESY